MIVLISKPKMQLLPWDACSVWSPPQLRGGGKQRQNENQSATSMSPDTVSVWVVRGSPSLCYLGLSHFSPNTTDFNPVNFPGLLLRLQTVYCQILFDFIKDLVTKYSHFHDHIYEDAVLEEMSSSICFLAIKEKMFMFSFFFPPWCFQTKQKAISNCYFFKHLLNN